MSFRAALMIHAVSPYKRRLNYLTSSGTQYIDTGIKLHGDYSVKVTFGQQLAYVDNKYRCVFGASSNGNFIFFQSWVDHSDWMARAYNNSTISFSYSGIDSFSTVEMRQGATYFDGGRKGGVTPTAAFEQSINCYLFKANTTTSVYIGAICSIARFEVFDGSGNKLQDLIPVSDFNDEPCMYDEVTGNFFRNAGSGSFLYG